MKNGIKKGKGLDLGAEPPCIKTFIIGQQTILPEPVLGALYIGGRKILVPGRSWTADQLYVGFTCRNFGPCGNQIQNV